MSSLKKNKVVIIEPSAVIQQGIKKLLEESSEFNVTRIYYDLQSFKDDKKDSTFDIILINPAIINFYKQFAVRTLFSDCGNVIIIAILYGYANTGTLGSFDGTLDIYDDAPKMVHKLKIITKAFDNQQNDHIGDNIDLSDREKEILVSVAKGLTNKEIADKHFISVHTVISHRKNITRKIGIKTVSGLTLYALFNNLSTQEDLQ